MLLAHTSHATSCNNVWSFLLRKWQESLRPGSKRPHRTLCPFNHANWITRSKQLHSRRRQGIRVERLHAHIHTHSHWVFLKIGDPPNHGIPCVLQRPFKDPFWDHLKFAGTLKIFDASRISWFQSRLPLPQRGGHRSVGHVVGSHGAHRDAR